MEERNQRELFTKELLYSLLSPEFDNLKLDNTIEKKKHEPGDEQCEQNEFLVEQFTGLTLIESNSSVINDNDTLCTGAASGMTSSLENSFTENLLLTKQCPNSEVVTFMSDEDDNSNHNDTSVS